MFEFLFKYPAEYFEQGSLVLALPWWQFLLLPLLIFVLAFILLGYFRFARRLEIRHQAFIVLMRSLVVSLVIFCLSGPLLEVTRPVPQPGLVGVLIDNSVSMAISNEDGRPRSDFVSRQLGSQGPLLSALRENFDTKLFQFGESTQPLTDVDTLNYNDGDSDLGNALDVVRESLNTQPLAGLVVVSDGAMQSSDELEAGLLSLRAAGVPVYSIGLGQANYSRDIELAGVKLPGRVLKDSRIVADVAINQQGYEDTVVELLVEDDSRILHKQPVRVKPGMQSVKVELDTIEAGPRQFKFHLAGRADELIAGNNSIQAMLSVDDTRMRILYYEGEPRFELKFIRRAVADDAILDVVGLVRTADAKYYRLGVESPKELRNGFPTTREELFSYHAIILGSVGISLLSREQQAMIADFVSQRGGGLLMLGGRQAFAEGGYRDTPLQEISPVVISDPAQPGFARQIRILPTPAGWVHPALSVADSREKSMARWLTLPALTSVNPIREIKPGATLLLSGTVPGEEENLVALASQRFGRGKVVAFPVQNSWLWQMHHDIELEDQTHELLWRQLLRWLVDSVPRRIDLSLSTDSIHANGVIRLRSEIRDADFRPDLEAQPRAIVTAVDGREQVKPLTRNPALRGVYEADIFVPAPGYYRVRVDLDEKGEVISSREAGFVASNEGREYHRSQMNEKLLRRISSETGGEFFTPEAVDGLVDALSANRSGSSLAVRYELWDMPLLFLLLVAFLCFEWGYRRWQNLV